MPVWYYTVDLTDVFHEKFPSFAMKRDAIVKVLRESYWVSEHDEDDPVAETVEWIAETENEDEFNAAWSRLYDYADLERAWIKTF